MPGELAALDGAALAAAIAEYERIDAVLGRAASYAGLLFAGDSEDAAIGRFYQGVNERVTQVSTPLIFFTLELNQLDDDALAGAAARPGPGALAAVPARPARVPPAPALRRGGAAAAREVGHRRSAWSRLFDETMAGMRVALGGASSPSATR